MPLLDHFTPPLSRTQPWRSFHAAWAAAIARTLNQGILPPGCYAVPLWIASDFSVPLDLEGSSQATCTDLRIRQAG